MERFPDIDPSIKVFRYSEAERAEMKAKQNLTDEQIDQKEQDIILKINRKAA